MSIPYVTSGTHASPSGSPMDEVLLDSDILIDHLRGYEPARQYLKRFEAGEMQGYLSIITVAEPYRSEKNFGVHCVNAFQWAMASVNITGRDGTRCSTTN